MDLELLLDVRGRQDKYKPRKYEIYDTYQVFSPQAAYLTGSITDVLVLC